MHAEDKAILKSLVAVAWADGRVAEEETEMIDALISAYNASEDETTELRAYAKQKRSLDDIPVKDLSVSDRASLLNHAVVLTFVDGHQDDDEKNLVRALADKLDIKKDDADKIIEAAEARARRLLQLL